ncbi:hypothetical protein [Sphingomonas sp. BAUL-RG-20F-R05-02]|uniref:hypothetical protein n=1 Tax=Sphingomonas sp. BAUL-RG-20F-R05-02 TaxID=2914830 RepID=UPI001F5AED4E|nr:hypothetical protein [Sphingomonas sp. BAUL-RG-20F-R05-02]
MMRGLMLAVVCLLIGAAPAEVPLGKFQTWFGSSRIATDFVSDGVKVHVEALPCPAQPIGESTCGFEGFNNQAAITVTNPRSASLTVTTDPQGSYARIAVVRFSRNDARPGVIIESQSGGSGGNLTAQVLIPEEDGYRAVDVGQQHGSVLEGELADFPTDVSGDGIIDLKLEDGAFDSAFGCNACTPRPPRLFAVKDGEVVDESRDLALRPVFAKEMARLAPICLSKVSDRNGACAAYVADAARAGRFNEAWTAMLKHYQRDQQWGQPCSVPVAAQVNGRCPRGGRETFPDALRAFLIRTGYLPQPTSASDRASSKS